MYIEMYVNKTLHVLSLYKMHVRIILIFFVYIILKLFNSMNNSLTLLTTLFTPDRLRGSLL